MIEEKEFIKQALLHPAGYDIGNAGFSGIRVLECKNFAVIEWAELGNDYVELIFDNVDEAVDKFLEIRYRRELGLDFFLGEVE
jgi:hypothetical protein